MKVTGRPQPAEGFTVPWRISVPVRMSVVPPPSNAVEVLLQVALKLFVIKPLVPPTENTFTLPGRAELVSTTPDPPPPPGPKQRFAVVLLVFPPSPPETL